MWHVNQHVRTSTCRAKWTGSIVKGNLAHDSHRPVAMTKRTQPLRARQFEPPSARTTYMRYARLTFQHSTATQLQPRPRGQISRMQRSESVAKGGGGPASGNGTSPGLGARISRTQTNPWTGECRSQPGPLAKPMAPIKCARLFKQITFTSSRGGCASAPRRARCCRS